MPDAQTRSVPWRPAALVVTALLATAFVAWVSAILPSLPPLPGRLQADPATGLTSSLADLTARLASLATLGALLAATIAPGERAFRWAARAGQVWFWAALVLTAANPAFVTGVPLGYALTPASWWTFVTSVPSGLAWLISALVALGAVLIAYGSRARAATSSWLVVGVVSWAFVAVTGNVSVGRDHDWATDAAIIGTLTLGPIAISAAASLLAPGTGRLRAHTRLVLALIAVAAASQVVVAWQELAGVSPFATAYGLPVIGSFAVLALLAVSALARRFSPEWDASGARAASVVLRDVVLVVAYAAFQTAAQHLPPPRFFVPQTIQENYLGYEMNVPVTLARLLGPGRPNLLWIVLAVAAVAVYVAATRRARRLGTPWPIWRTVSWLLGWGLMVYLATSGFWEYSTVVFSWHMFVHMTVNMLVPVLCVLGAPMALVAAASPERPAGEPPSLGQLASDWADYRTFQLLTAPPLLWLGYVGSLFAVYYTPAFSWLMRYHWAHQLMLLAFMVTGYGFFNLLIGPERSSWQMPHLVKLALLISIMPFHAIFAVGILSSQSLFGEEFYQSIDIAWVGNLMADQNIAGQITWILGEVPIVLVIIALAAQWFRQDRVDSSRFDLAQDSGEEDALGAYNDMLRQLAERDAEDARRRANEIGLRP